MGTANVGWPRGLVLRLELRAFIRRISFMMSPGYRQTFNIGGNLTDTFDLMMYVCNDVSVFVLTYWLSVINRRCTSSLMAHFCPSSSPFPNCGNNWKDRRVFDTN